MSPKIKREIIFARLLWHMVIGSYHLWIERFGGWLAKRHHRKAVHHLGKYYDAEEDLKRSEEQMG